MATRNQDERDIFELVKTLRAKKNAPKDKEKGKGKHRGFSCKSTSYNLGSNTLESWRFQEWDYKRDDLPIYARGLFTQSTGPDRARIAVRGYDKFFNVEEVNDTKWRNLEINTKGPYELSVKENGCIIFLSGLPDGTLICCSKHSLGELNKDGPSHAQTGEKWVAKHLGALGKTEADLAAHLYKNNMTAVAELCDDEFEEHVLAYDKASAGLYLHGLNFNTPHFNTLSSDEVGLFAEQWGFRKVQYVVKNDLAAVKKLLDECAETGSYSGRETEGFVIRCQKRQGGPESTLYDNFFFKFKFEEPYLMYRQWRECTKAIIKGWAPKMFKHRKSTEDYLLYVRREFVKNPKLKDAYMKNHGIIELRDGFLASVGKTVSDLVKEGENDASAVEGEGESEKESSEADKNLTDNLTNDLVLVPIATIGCGKTTLALALVHLFGWGHVQNDNISSMNNRPKTFANLCKEEMRTHPVVIADRNNHQKRERRQLIQDLSRLRLSSVFVALHYVHTPKSQADEVRRVTRKRVLTRGDNHQTIQANTMSEDKILSIMEGFLSRFEAVDVKSEPDKGFEHVINLDPTEDTLENLRTVVSELHAKFPKIVPRVPTEVELQNALDVAIKNYKVETKHELSFNKTPQKKNNTNPARDGKDGQVGAPRERPVEYFAVKLSASPVLVALTQTFSPLSAADQKFYKHLQQMKRVQTEFHVTLAHKNSAKDKAAVWEALMQRYGDAKAQGSHGQSNKLGKCDVTLDSVVWDNKVMAIACGLDGDWAGRCANEIPHVTVGTGSSSIKPFESNAMLARWRVEGANQVSGLGEAKVSGGLRLEGEVVAVLSR